MAISPAHSRISPPPGKPPLLLAQGRSMIEYINATSMDIEVSDAIRAVGAPLSAAQARDLLALASGFPEDRNLRPRD